MSSEARPNLGGETQQYLEAGRIEALRASGLLEFQPEPAFDELTQLAAYICGTPIALISLVDESRQWFLSATGLDCRETLRSESICTQTILEEQILLIEDVRTDPRFRDLPLVRQEPGIRFYAGVPFRGHGGHALGSLCVIDLIPRQLTSIQIAALRTLARSIEIQISLGEKVARLETAEEENGILMGALAASEARFRAFMDHSPVVAYIKDEDGRMRYYNRALADMYHITPEQWLGKRDHEIWPIESAEQFRETDLSVLARGQAVELEECSPEPDGGVVYWKSYKFPLTDSQGNRCLAGMSINITTEKQYGEQLRLANEALQELTLTDPLTGLGNRRAFDRTLAACLGEAPRTRQPISILLIDVDRFKRVNDQNGHPYGDAVLRSIGETVRETVRYEDHVSRYGGEEFAVILRDSSLEEATVAAERVRKAVKEIEFPAGPITVSIGVAFSLRVSSDFKTLIGLADEALYAAKRGGRDQVQLSVEGLIAVAAS